ncbi:uncharacterized protein LOC143293770 [Babylonia areolata]|uniref:uncharacterized protein LOC143293770 n=1 Tax=Babylonia areolata TaxID=304850 RepID=UPI003FD28FF8
MDTSGSQPNHLENMSVAMHVARDWVLQALSLLLYVLTRRLVVTFQKFTWAIFGVERVRRDARRGLQFKQSAHVQEILWRRKLKDCSVADPSNFITKHKCFKHPSHILRPHVSLYCITRHEAVFVQTEEGQDVYRGGPLHLRQFHLAQYVITMPLASFHKTASDVGVPRVPLAWLSCTPRSGSTLLAHVLGSAPNMRVLNEPDALTCLAVLHRGGKLPTGEYSQLLTSAVRLLCKPDDRCGVVLVKARPAVTRLIEDLYPAFPRATYLFLYRNSLKSLNSCLALAAADPASMALRFLLDSRALSTVFPCGRRWLHAALTGVNVKPSSSLRPSSLSASGIATAAWAAGVACVSELRDRGVPVRALLYEDLMRNPRATCLALFKMLELRPDYVSQALQEFRKDFNRSPPPVQQADSRRALAPEARQEADMVLKAHGLPKLGERMELPGLVKFD